MLKSVYNGFRNLLPQGLKVRMSKIVFKMLDKPIYDETGKVSLDKGVVVISADFELAWAWRYSKMKVDILQMARQERENFPIILNKLNELEIPVTWATVGHLFLDSCECKNGRAHNNMPRPSYFENEYWKFDKGDWYDMDPCGDYKRNPEFYASDLIEMILKSNVKHEIGCHSFSHCDFSEKNSYPELIEAELMESELAMKKFGIKPVSFVFPGNQYGNFDILKRKDYKVIRYKTEENKEIGFPELLKNGLTALHDSISFEPGEKGWKNEDLIWRAKKYIDKAIDKKAICHFWFHPSIDTESINLYLFKIMDYLYEKRGKSQIDIKTLNSFAIN